MYSAKAELRKKAAQISKTLLPDDGLIAQKVIKKEVFLQAKYVFCFVSVNTEPNTQLIINTALKMGKILCVPRGEGNGIMHAHQITSLQELYATAFGIMEPCANAKCISPSQIDLAIVPCVAASLNKERLGHGAGYYDRFLPQTKAYKLLLCRRELLMPYIPYTQLDVLCDEIIY